MTAPGQPDPPPPQLLERRSAARHGWATHGVVMVATAAGDLVAEVPGQLYAGIAGWRSRASWLTALGAHPRLAEAARRHQTCPSTLLKVAEHAADYAHPVSGRGIAVAHGTIATKLGLCAKQVQRCFWAAEDLGLLVRVLDGSDMTLQMRMQVRDHYRHGDTRGTRSKLPNVYAATIPRWLATRLPGTQPKPARGTSHATAPVDNPTPPVDNPPPTTAREPDNVHPPVGGTTTPPPGLPPHSRRTAFDTACAQNHRSQPDTDTTAAARPTRTHQGKSPDRPARRLDPAAEQLARALRRELPGFRDVSLHRICPALSRYAHAGLTATDLRHGLDDHLATAGRTWLTTWQPDQGADQARYLIAMLTRARLAGHIRPPNPHNTW